MLKEVLAEWGDVAEYLLGTEAPPLKARPAEKEVRFRNVYMAPTAPQAQQGLNRELQASEAPEVLLTACAGNQQVLAKMDNEARQAQEEAVAVVV